MPTPIRVALIEDHALVREGIERALNEVEGIDVVWSADSPQQYLDSGITADVALLDLDFADGLVSPATVDRILDSGTKVLVVTANPTAPVVRDLVLRGIHGVIPKTQSTPTVINALLKISDGEYWTTRELAGALANAEPADIDELSDQERRAIRLYASGLKISEVASHMGVSPNTVKSYLKRARAKLALGGRPTSTQRDLYAEAVRQGIITE